MISNQPWTLWVMCL